MSDAVLDKNLNVPAYMRIKEFLRKRIVQEGLPAHTKLPSEQELAVHHNVSRMTARHAFTELVNEKVIYRINGKGSFVAPVAGTESETTTGAVGVIMPNVGRDKDFDAAHSPTHFFTLYGAQPLLREFDFDVTIFSKKPDQFDLGLLRSAAVDAFLVLYPHKSDIRLLHDLQLCGKPFVAVNSPLLISGMNRADFDMNHAGKTIVEHLLERGRTEICFISDEAVNHGAEWFFEGMRDALASHELNSARFAFDGNRKDGGSSLDGVLKDAIGEFDAIVTTSDTLAAGIIKKLSFLGVNVPEEIAVTGYGDSNLSSKTTLAITSFSSPCERLGAVASKLLLRLFDDPGIANAIMTVRPELVVRDST